MAEPTDPVIDKFLGVGEQEAAAALDPSQPAFVIDPSGRVEMISMAEESDFAKSEEQPRILASNPYEDVEPGQTVHTVSPEVGEVLQAQAKRIADLEVMCEAQRTLTANAVADVERQQAGERARRIDLEQVSRARKWAIDALIEALVPFASFASEEDGNIRGMTEPVCLSMAAVRRADALVKLHQALR